MESDSHPHEEHKINIPNNRRNIKNLPPFIHFSEEDLEDFSIVKERRRNF